MFIKVKNYNGQKVRYIQHKLDGYCIHVTNKTVHTKKLEIMHKFDHCPLGDFFRSMVNGFAVLGELHAPGIPATSIPTLINDRDLALQFTAFALPSHPVLTCCLAVNKLLMKHGFTYPTTSVLSKPIIVSKEQLCKEAERLGIEGFVVKQEHLKGWYKIKPVQTMDVVVTGTERSWSAQHYSGMKCICIGKFGSVGSGFTEEYRREVDRKSLIGRTAEVSFDSIAANGKLRFPRFLRWRDDEK